MAAALIAALFAMGVFSATGVGADGHVTAALVDNNTPATPDDSTDDQLVISLTGLSAVGASTDNDIIVTLNAADLGSIASAVTLSWGGGSQFGDELTSPTESDGAYTFGFSAGTSIVAGDATITITPSAGSRIDSNTRITALTIGRGTGATQNEIEIPAGGIGIADAPAGPSITLEETSAAVFVGDDAALQAADPHMLKLTGSDFDDDVEVTLASTGSSGTVAFDPTSPILPASIDDGEFEVEVSIPVSATAETITITAEQGGDSVTAEFAINTPPVFDFEDEETSYDNLMFALDDTVARVVEVDADDADTGAELAFSAQSSNDDVATAEVMDEEEGEVTVTPVGPGTATITVTVSDGVTDVDTTFDVTIAGPPTVALSSQTPSAAVQITIEASTAEAIGPNQDIQVDLSAFSVPSTIADSAIDITSGSFNGSPTNVLVSGKKVTMTVPNVLPNGEEQDKDVEGNYTIKIKQSAGVENPASAGEKTVKWVEDAPNTAEAANKEAKVDVQRLIKVSKKNGTRGTESEATFLGFANGTATVSLNGDKLDEVTIADNTGTLSLDTSSSDYKANQDNVITAVDAGGVSQDVSATFTIKPKLVLDPEETSVSKSVTLKLSDWPLTNTITKVTIGSTDSNPTTSQSTGGEGKVEFDVLVPGNTNRGTQTVKVTGTEIGTGDDASTPSATASLSVGVLALDVEPSSVVPGQEITIQGSGFKGGDTLTSLMIGGESVSIPDNNKKASSNGDVVVTVQVPSPSGTASGKKTVILEAGTSVENNSGRVAEGSIEIPKASITLSPEISRRGTTVSVSGSGFPANDLVQVQYDRDGSPITVTAKAADSAGNVEVDFDVPSYAKIGSKHDVQAKSVGIYDAVTAKGKHETPGAEVTLSPARVPNGGQLTLSGMNFPAFATVAEMMVGGVDVRPVPAPATSIDGDFESTVLVPQMELGNQSVSVRVAQTTFTTFVEIVSPTVVVLTDPAEVFADLIESGSLSRVWYLDPQSQTWSFYDPDPAFAAFNELTAVTSEETYILIITAEDTFGTKTLYPGTQFVTIP